MAKKFTDAEVDSALTAYALQGSVSEAVAILDREFDLQVSEATIRNWTKGAHRERYLEITNKYADHVRVELANAHEKVARKAIEGAEDATDMLVGRLRNEGKGWAPHEIGLALKHLSSAANQHQKSSDVLRGRPTEIRENRSDEEFMKRLQRDPKLQAAMRVVNGEAVIDAQVVEEKVEDAPQIPDRTSPAP